MKLPTRLWGGRPPRWFRIISAALAVLFAVELINAHRLIDVFWGALACSLMLMNAIAPKGLYDGRFDAWTRKHPMASAVLLFIVLGGIALAVLSDYVQLWLAAVIVLPLSAAVAPWAAYRGSAPRSM